MGSEDVEGLTEGAMRSSWFLPKFPTGFSRPSQPSGKRLPSQGLECKKPGLPLPAEGGHGLGPLRRS